MANQRMFIRCKACGAERFLAKRMLGNFYTYSEVMKWNEWDEWFEDHVWGLCHPEGKWSEDGLDVFELSYEHHIEGHHSKSDGGA